MWEQSEPCAELTEEYQIRSCAALAEGPGAAGSVAVTLMPAGILGRGTAHSFALGNAATDAGRAVPQGGMVPQPRAETNAPGVVRAK